ncbi:MAG TPA: SDR family NAD(P)-dependent oxidoreductase, partial [Marmoricola sp.]|nr:SDR family NAD(P)-dependent oxidoreductase [Marmoricola sp.]
EDGFKVICAARRLDRLEALATEIGGVPVQCDVTNSDDIARLASIAGPSVSLLVNNAGGAIGSDSIENADLEVWQRMYDTNVLSVVRVTRALLPALRAARGAVITVSSTAGRNVYEGGGGYAAAKHGTRVVVETLRLELNGEPVRVTEVAPGMVHTEEFSLVRFGGDHARADAVYADVDRPLVAADVAEVIRWIASLPEHVNIDSIVVRPVAQAAQFKTHRGPIFDS